MTETTYTTMMIHLSELIYVLALIASFAQAAVVFFYILQGANGLSRNQFSRHVLVAAYCGYEIYLHSFYLFQDLLVLAYLVALVHAMWLSSSYFIQPVIGRKLGLGDSQQLSRKRRTRTGTIETILDRVDGTVVDEKE